MKYGRFIFGVICLLLIGGTLRFMLNSDYPKEADLILIRKRIRLHEDSLVTQAFDFLMQNTSVPQIENLLNKKESDNYLLKKDIVQAVDVYLESNLKWNIPFDVFCEYVLPPLVYDEDYIYWRKICYDKYADWVNRKKSTVEICSVINADLCFLSVFNSNEWIPVAAAISHNRKVLFEDMNTNLLYLYWDSHHSFPFILDRKGKQKILLADDSRKIAFTIRWLCSREMEFQKSWNKFSIEYFDGIAKDSYRSSPVNDSTYILCIYKNNAWQPISEAVCHDENLSFTSVPANGLYILVDRMNRIKSQCFTYQSGAVLFW